MIRGNLATRPFYNARAIHRWLVVAAVLIGALTILNVGAAVRYTRSDADLKSQADRDEQAATERRAAATSLQQGVSAQRTQRGDRDIDEANQIIARRTFSWTALFNRFETALPPGVRITAVRPAAEAGTTRLVLITVIARDVESVDTFMRNLEDTGAFADALSLDERVNDQGQIEGSIQASYRPAGARAVPAGATGP